MYKDADITLTPTEWVAVKRNQSAHRHTLREKLREEFEGLIECVMDDIYSLEDPRDSLSNPDCGFPYAIRIVAESGMAHPEYQELYLHKVSKLPKPEEHSVEGDLGSISL